MSSAMPPDSISSSLPIILDSALKQYTAKAGIDMATYRLAGKLGGCTSVDAVIDVFQDQLSILKKYTIRRGKLPRVLEAVKPIVSAVLSLSENGVLDACLGSAFPPAQAILSCIGILLQAARKVGESYDMLVGLFDSIMSFLGRLKIYDRAALPTPVAEVAVKVVAEMLSIFAFATKEIERGRLKKFGKTLLGDKGIEDALQRMDRLTQEEHQVVVAQTYSNTEEIKSGLQRVLDNQDSTKQDDMQSRYRTWLDPPDPSTNHILACKGHHAGTSAWFLEGPIFEAWRKAGSLMWIHGKPGSGKSVLCSTIIQELERLHSEELDVIVAYFYFDFRDSKKQDFRGMLTSLIIQLAAASGPLRASVSRLYSTHGSGLKQPGDDALVQCLKGMLAASGQVTTYVILDALDECPNNRASPPRHEILSFLDMLTSVRSSDLRICITSRPEDDIATALRPLALHRVCLEEESGHALDMVRYIRHTVENNLKVRRWKEKTRNLVIETLSENADGMFRYVACQLDILCNCPPAAVEATLQTLPKTLYATYESTLRRIDDDSEDNWRHAHRIFQCLAFSARPLSVEEIAEVLAVDFTQSVPSLNPDWRPENVEDAILSTCPGSFVVVVKGDRGKIVQFAHFSVKEFLTSDRLAKSPDCNVSRFHILPEPAHEVLAQTCLAALLQVDASVDEHSMRNHPLSHYAAQHWGDHARADGVLCRVIGAAELLFDQEKPHFSTWSWIQYMSHYRRDWSRSTNIPIDEPPPPLWCAADLGLVHFVDRIVTSQPGSVNTKCGKMGTALQVAAWRGHYSVVRALVKHGADANASSYYLWTALQSVSRAGCLEVAQLLLKHGADANARGGDDVATALEVASQAGHLDITRLLLEHGADVNVPLCDDGPALQAAAWKGHLDIVRLLLEHGADVNVQHRDGTALQSASSAGHLEIARLLLEHGADLNAPPHGEGSALQAAALKGHLEIARLLLEHGAGVDGLEGWEGGALQCASRGGHLKIARLLLEHGADVNAPGSRCGSPLYQASREGHFRIAQLLLEYGADANAALGGQYRISLRAASEAGHLEITGLLLEHGADVNAVDGRDGTALRAASRGGHIRIARLLLEHGADVNAPSAYGETALQAASRAGRLEIAQLLLDRGAAVNTVDNLVESPLHLASQEGHLEIVRLLLERGAVVNAVGGFLGSALHLASCRGHLEITQLLLEHGADVNVDCGASTLEAASQGGHLKIAQLLLEHGLDANARCGNGGTALQSASREGHLEIVKLLLGHGADVNAADGRDGTPLQAASRGGHLWVVRLLLGHGADVDAPGSGWDFANALQAALAGGHLEIAKTLLEHGANIYASEHRFGTAFHAAAAGVYKNPTDVMRLLIDHGASVNFSAGECGSLLTAAVRNGVMANARWLLEHDVDVNTQGSMYGTALQAAFFQQRGPFLKRYGVLEIVQLLLDNGANVNTQVERSTFGNALAAASYFGSRHIVQMLLDRGADVNAVCGKRFATALTAGSYKGKVEVVQTLLGHGADVNPQAKEDPILPPSSATQSDPQTESSTGQAEYTTPLTAASACESRKEGVDIARLLLQRGANVNARGSIFGTALVVASHEGNLGMILLLLSHGADVNDEGGGVWGNALQAASRGGKSDAVRLLLELGADVNARGTSVPESAQSIVSAKGHTNIVNLLSTAHDKRGSKRRMSM